MRFLLLASLVLLILPATRAAHAPDDVLLEGLRAVQANSLEAGLRTWYMDRPDTALEIRDKINVATKHMGAVIDTEIIAVQPISKRVTRYYFAIYFKQAPLWLRIDRYANEERAFYFPLTFSFNPDTILPGYVTEFRVP